MSNSSIHAVTGAFGYSGKYIAQRLLAAGRQVITLTNSTDRANEFGGRLPVYPFHFDQPDELAASLAGVEVLYNTYWVRFNHPLFRHADAVRNTLILFDAAGRMDEEIAVLRRLRSDWHAAVIVLADFPRCRERDRFLAAGARAVVAKPFLWDDLFWHFGQVEAERLARKAL